MNKDNLVKILKLCAPALGNDLIPGLDSFHFTADSILAYNGALLIKANLPESPIVGSILGQSFFKLLNDLPSEIEFLTEGNSLLVKSGRLKSLFPIENIDLTFLNDAEETLERKLLPTNKLLAYGLKRCLTSISVKGFPQEEVGVHIFIENSECRLYSTNLSAYSRFIFPLESEFPNNEIFLPASFCEQLVFLYAELNREPNEIVVTQKYVRANFGDVTLRHNFHSSIVNQTMRQQVDQGIEEVTLVPLSKDLIGAIKHSEIIAGNNSIKLDYGDPESGKVFISANGAKQQSLYEEIDMPYPLSGTLNLDIKNLRKSLESSKEIGFGEDYLLLIGEEDYYDLIINGKES